MTDPSPPQKSLPPPPPSSVQLQKPAGRPPVAAPPPQPPYPVAPVYGHQAPPQGYGQAPQYGQPPPPGYGYPPVNQVFVQPYAPVVVLPTKSVGLSLVLTFFFGPLGMLYSTVAGGVIMFFVEIVVAVVTLGFGLLITWPICMIWGAVAAQNYNNRLLTGQGQLRR